MHLFVVCSGMVVLQGQRLTGENYGDRHWKGVSLAEFKDELLAVAIESNC